MFYKLKTAPTGEPVTLEEALAHLRVDLADEDVLIGSLIQAAREHAEAVTRRAFLTQTWQVRLPAFRRETRLAHIPLQSVTAITYDDSGGAQQTVANTVYEVDTFEGAVRQAHGETWPAAQPYSVVIEFVAGYGDAADVPQAIKQAMLLLIGHWYENRQDVVVGATATEVPMAVESLLSPYRVMML